MYTKPSIIKRIVSIWDNIIISLVIFCHPIVFIHELGHHICTMKIAKKHNLLFHKPYILIGNRSKGKFKRSGKIIGLLIIKCKMCIFDKSKGVTLYPYYQCFTDEELKACFKAGYLAEFYVSIPFCALTLFLYLYSLFTIDCKYALIAIIPLIFAITLIVSATLTKFSASGDALYAKNPQLFDFDKCKSDYYKFLEKIVS